MNDQPASDGSPNAVMFQQIMCRSPAPWYCSDLLGDLLGRAAERVVPNDLGWDLVDHGHRLVPGVTVEGR